MSLQRQPLTLTQKSENHVKIQNKFMGKILRVTTKNGRIFQGKLKAIDFRCNLILHETIAQIPDHLNCELNTHLQNCLDIKLTKHLQQMNVTSADEIKKYMGSHFYFGSVLISGDDIKQILLKKNQQKKVKKEQNNQNNEKQSNQNQKQQSKKE